MVYDNYCEDIKGVCASRLLKRSDNRQVMPTLMTYTSPVKVNIKFNFGIVLQLKTTPSHIRCHHLKKTAKEVSPVRWPKSKSRKAPRNREFVCAGDVSSEATVNEAYSLASQRGLSKSPTGRLPLPFPVGSPGRVYFALFAQNIAGLMQTDIFKCLNDTRWGCFIK